MELSYAKEIAKEPPLIIELVGLAGSGKTTLAKTLSQKNEQIHISEDIKLRKVHHLIIFIKHALSLLPFLYSQYQSKRGYSWDEIKSVVYLEAWAAEIKKQITNKNTFILLDHGPVFKLAKLDAFGPEISKSGSLSTWSQNMIKQWADTLDVVIWLDAPDEILLERINQRNQKHAVKGKSDQKSLDFIDRYRKSYQEILSQLTSYGGTSLLRYDANQSSAEQIADNVFAAFNLINLEN